MFVALVRATASVACVKALVVRRAQGSCPTRPSYFISYRGYHDLVVGPDVFYYSGRQDIYKPFRHR